MDAKAAGIPVGVIDTGLEQVQDWGLDLWVGGGSEYQNGVRAGEKMGKAGVKHAICVNQEVGNVSLDDRCHGCQGRPRQGRRQVDVVAVTMDPTETSSRVEAYLTAHGRRRHPGARAGAAGRSSRLARPAQVQGQDRHLRPLAGSSRGDRQGRDAVRARQPAISDGLSAGRVLHHEGDVRDAADRRRHDRPGLHHEGRAGKVLELSKQGIR